MPLDLPPEPPVAFIAQSRAEAAFVRNINRARRRHGLRAVRINHRLARVARRHSRDMLRHDVLSHSSSDGRAFTARLRGGHSGRRVGEVLAWAPRGMGGGSRTVVRMWMQSPTHRAVLLDSRLRSVGIGRMYGSMGSAGRGHAITADFSG